MADGALKLTLEAHESAKLAERASALGVTPDQLAADLITRQLFDSADFTWANGNPSDPLPPRDVNEPTHAWDDVKSELQAQRAAARRKRA